MRALWTYPIELRHEEGEIHAYSADLPEAIAGGMTEEEALDEMRHALTAAVRGRMKDGMDLSPPSGQEGAGFHAVALPAQLAAKATVYVTWKDANISKVELAGRLHRDEKDVRRILDPDHGTKLEQMDEAVRAMGGQLVIGYETA